jgi:hypothetical protein
MPDSSPLQTGALRGQTLVLVALSQPVWTQYLEIARLRDYREPPRPRDGIWICSDKYGGGLVGGVCLLPTEVGGYVLVEHAMTHPAVSIRDRAQAWEFGLTALRTYCTVRGMTPRFMVKSNGMRRFLQRRGWGAQAAIPMYLWPLQLTAAPSEPRPRPSSSPVSHAPHAPPARAARARARAAPR